MFPATTGRVPSRCTEITCCDVWLAAAKDDEHRFGVGPNLQQAPSCSRPALDSRASRSTLPGFGMPRVRVVCRHTRKRAGRGRSSVRLRWRQSTRPPRRSGGGCNATGCDALKSGGTPFLASHRGSPSRPGNTLCTAGMYWGSPQGAMPHGPSSIAAAQPSAGVPLPIARRVLGGFPRLVGGNRPACWPSCRRIVSRPIRPAGFGTSARFWRPRR